MVSELSKARAAVQSLPRESSNKHDGPIADEYADLIVLCRFAGLATLGKCEEIRRRRIQVELQLLHRRQFGLTQQDDPELLETVARLYDQAHADLAALRNPLFAAACREFPSRLNGSVVEVSGCVFQSGEEVAEAIRMVHLALRGVADGKPGSSVVLPPLTIAPTLVIDAKGITSVRPDFVRSFLLPAIDRRDRHRLGACPICERLFVRLRSDQKACNPRCADIKRHDDSRGPARQRNRQHKKRQLRLVRTMPCWGACKKGGRIHEPSISAERSLLDRLH
jgi:hypothetical protein